MNSGGASNLSIEKSRLILTRAAVFSWAMCMIAFVNLPRLAMVASRRLSFAIVWVRQDESN